MPFPSRPADLPDLLRQLTQASVQQIPDNPAEVLTDYVSAPSNSLPDDVAVTDSTNFPNAGHSGTYTYNNAASLWNKSQWS